MKTILITGANKGIGFGIAEALGKTDVHVLIGARNEERGMEAVNNLEAQGIKADFLQVDLADSSSIDQAIETVKSDYPETSILINNAGVPGPAKQNNADITVEDLKQAMQVNFFGTFQLTNGLIPIIENNHGSIVNITIPTVPNPVWNPLAYKTTKAAQNVMMESMAVDFEQDGRSMPTYSVHPGPVTTDLNHNLKLPGFSTIEQVGQEISELVLDGKNHQGQLVELHEELK